MQNIHIIIKLYDNLLLVSIFKKARMSIWNCLKDCYKEKKMIDEFEPVYHDERIY